METLEDLRKKIEDAAELKSIVRTMKAMAASNIGQYNAAVAALDDYYRTVSLGLTAFFHQESIGTISEYQENQDTALTFAIVFGSDQGLVGQFNNSLLDFVSKALGELPGDKEIWAVGERAKFLLTDSGFLVSRLFSVPNSVAAITPLVGQILIRSQETGDQRTPQEFYVFHNRPRSRSEYEPVKRRFLPLDEQWRLEFSNSNWITNKRPQIAGLERPTLKALIREYLFVSLFRACAESLASENSSRLAAMQRAEKNIEELLDELNHQYHSQRQSSIDEELFDVIAGFEALK